MRAGKFQLMSDTKYVKRYYTETVRKVLVCTTLHTSEAVCTTLSTRHSFFLLFFFTTKAIYVNGNFFFSRVV